MGDKREVITDLATQEYINILFSLSESIFHDFKNILATISGLSQLSALDVQSNEVRENLNTINKATFECRDVIDRFYSFIKGYDTDYKENIVLGKIILNSLDMIKHRLSSIIKQGGEIELNLNINSLNKIYCNEYRMKQGILNILLNAIDAMDESGGILEVNLYEEDENMVLEIIDTGIGISKENLDKIFLCNFTTKGEKGTGLGLKISKDVFEDHGGKIFVESKLGSGTKFTIILPTSEINSVDVLERNIYNN